MCQPDLGYCNGDGDCLLDLQPCPDPVCKECGKAKEYNQKKRSSEMYELILMGGKYTVKMSDDMKVFKALRYGEPWQDLCGNNLVYALVCRVKELEERLGGMIGSE
jgi:hypothetical protein